MQNKEYKKTWAKANHEKVAAAQKKWATANPEYNRLNVKTWQKSNPDFVLAKNAKRRSSKLQRTPSWLTKDQLKEIQQFYKDAKDLQWLSDINDPLEVDHIVPLRGKIVSGLHVPWNLQILPKSMNCSKGNK